MARSTGGIILFVLGGAAAVCGAVALTPLLRADESLADRRAQVEAMNASEKKDILRRQRLFDGLERPERERLWKLHEDLEQSANRDELRRVMDRYCDWLAELTSYERAELQELPAEERVKRVKKLLDEHEARRRAPGGFPSLDRARRPWAEMGPDARRRPGPDDLKAVFEWFGHYLEEEKTRLVEALPQAWRKQAEQAIESSDNPAKRRERLTSVWMRWLVENPGKMPNIEDSALAELRGRLSPETRAWLEPMPPSEQRRIVLGWMRFIAMFHLGVRGPDPALPVVQEEELAKFFENELTGEQKNRLLNLPSDEMRRELRQEYLRWRLKDESPRIPMWHSWRRGYRSGGSPYPGRDRMERPSEPKEK